MALVHLAVPEHMLQVILLVMRRGRILVRVAVVEHKLQGIGILVRVAVVEHKLQGIGRWWWRW